MSLRYLALTEHLLLKYCYPVSVNANWDQKEDKHINQTDGCEI